MLEENGGTLRTVAWSEVCPWLAILRTFRMAISLRVLVLAAVAIFLTLSGWSLLGLAFLEKEEPAEQEMPEWMGPADGCPWHAINEAVPNEPNLHAVGDRLKADPLAPTAWQALDPYIGSWAQLSRPLWEARNPDVDLPKLACLLLCGLWSVAVWAFFGGAITRIAAVQLACDERVGWAAALRHARSKWLSYFAAPLCPLIGVVLAALPVWVLGWLLHVNVGILLAALIWPLALLGGLVMVILLLGLIFGWPLMWATISAEGTDSFDALSRSYAYVFGRPLRYLFYVIVAAVLGALGWLLVQNFAAAVVGATYWTAGWTAGAQIDLIKPGGDELTGVGYAGAVIIRFCAGCVKLLAVGFIYGYFWTASTAIYFLLRRDVDDTEMDEVFLDEDASEPTYGLPPLKSDEAGAPVVDDDVPEVEPDDFRQPEEEPDDEPQS
ncbi:MAG: hypothetical protein ACYSWU_25320 [Planctomycetota bacterium]